MRVRTASASIIGAWESWTDLVAGSDPGFNRLIVATRGSLTIVLALAGEWLFVRDTGALEKPLPAHASPSQAAAVAVQHHDILVVAMLLGGLVGLMTALNVNERSMGGQATTLVYIPAALLAALTIGLALGPYRAPALVVMVVVLAAGAYGRRFGPRGLSAGIILFLGYFFGFFLSATLPISAAGWLAAEILLAAAAGAMVRFVIFRPSPAADIRRALRSYESRARRVLYLSQAYFDGPDTRRRRALERWLVRLDEAALIVEGQLDQRGALPLGTAVRLRQWLFDVELALSNTARFVELLAADVRRPEPRQLIRSAMAGVANGDAGAACQAAGRIRALLAADGGGSEGHGGGDQAPYAWQAAAGVDPNVRVVLHRFAATIEVLARSLPEWSAAKPGPMPGEHIGAAGAAEGEFEPAVRLRAGWLPGTADVSVEASQLPGSRVRMAPYLRTTAQVTVAVSMAIVVGDALDASRFYWAVVAALLALVGTNTVAEQLRKALYRVVGTLVGVVAGTALVDAVGTHSLWSVVVVVASMWVGMYLIRVNYAFMATAITVSLSQAYLALGEFSGGLLTERLAETAVGAGAAMVTVLVVVPLRTRRVLDVATADLVETVAALAEAALSVLTGVADGASVSSDAPHRVVPAGLPAPGGTDGLRGAGRRVDATYQALVTTAEPLRMVSWADSQDRVTRLVAAATAARNYGRNLVFDSEGTDPVDVDHALQDGRRVLADSAAKLAASLRGPTGADARTYTRAGSLLVAAERTVTTDPARPSRAMLVLRDLTLVDAALAAIARSAGLAVRTLDTEPAAGVAAGESPGRAPRGAGEPRPGRSDA